MGVEDDAFLEAQEKVLSSRVGPDQALADKRREALRLAAERAARARRLGGNQGVLGQGRAEANGGTVDGVSFRHPGPQPTMRELMRRG
jgi:hypothetical protein